jgi:hypothetical protein
MGVLGRFQNWPSRLPRDSPRELHAAQPLDISQTAVAHAKVAIRNRRIGPQAESIANLMISCSPFMGIRQSP